MDLRPTTSRSPHPIRGAGFFVSDCVIHIRYGTVWIRL